MCAGIQDEQIVFVLHHHVRHEGLAKNDPTILSDADGFLDIIEMLVKNRCNVIVLHGHHHHHFDVKLCNSSHLICGEKSSPLDKGNYIY